MFKKLMNLLSPDDEDYEDDYIDEEYMEEDGGAVKFSKTENSNSAIHLNRGTVPAFVFSKPVQFDDVFAIADAVNEHQIVTINLENTNEKDAYRILDFLSGVAYTNDAEIHKFAKNIVSVIPSICEYKELNDTEKY